jgi:DNA-binding beta-propeller fold protein YncE
MPATMEMGAIGIALDVVNNEIFVADAKKDAITVYQRTAGGNAEPARSISGSSAGLSGPCSIAVDPSSKEILIGNRFDNSITTYKKTSSGEDVPLRRIAGSATGISDPRSLFVDVTNNEIYVANNSARRGSVTVYARTANGNVAPLRTIAGESTELDGPRALSVDTTHNELFVLSGEKIIVYARTDDGNVAPLRTVSGDATRLRVPQAIVVDGLHDEIIVADGPTNELTVYRRTAAGDAAPLRSISGWLEYPYGLSYDAKSDKIAVMNGNNSITIFDRTASGRVPNNRTYLNNISGLQGLRGISFGR